MINIYDVNCKVLMQAEITSSAIRVEELSKSDYISLSWNSAEKVILPAGAYIVHKYKIDKVREVTRQFLLLESYEPTQSDEMSWKYTPEFQHPKMILSKIPFFIRTRNSKNEVVKQYNFNFFGTMVTIADKLKDFLNNELKFGNAGWVINYNTTNTNAINVSFSDNDFMSALTAITNAIGDNYEWHIDYDNETIHIGNVLRDDLPIVTLKVGENVGIPSITNSKEDYYNAFAVFGGTRNITQVNDKGENISSSDIKLQLSKGSGTTEIDGKKISYSIDEFSTIDMRQNKNEQLFTKILNFAQIYPSLNTYVYNVRGREKYVLQDGNKIPLTYNADGSVKTYKTFTVWYVRMAYPTTEKIADKKLVNTTVDNGVTHYWYDFEVTDDLLINGKNIGCSFETNFNEGALSTPLAGRGTNGDYVGFELTYHKEASSTHTTDDVDSSNFTVLAGDFEIIYQEDNDLIIPTNAKDMIIPKGESLPSYKCNITVLYNIAMAESIYTEDAQKRLLDAAMKEIKRLLSDLNNYSVKSYPQVFEAKNPCLQIGQKVVYDDGNGYQLNTRAQKISTNIDFEFVQEITVGNEVIKGNTAQLKEDVKEIIASGGSGSGGGGNYTTSQLKNLIGKYGTVYFVSKLFDDTAEGLITFAKGLVAKGLADLMMGARFGNNAKITELGEAFFRAIKSLDYDNAAEQGFSVEKEKNGKYHAFFTNLTIWGKARFHELEVRKLSYSGGNIYLSGAGSKLIKVVPVRRIVNETYDYEWMECSEKICDGWKCYLLADNGTTATMNYWQEGDQARCQTMGEIVSGGTYQNASNKSYWRTIPDGGVSTQNEKIYGTKTETYIDEDGNEQTRDVQVELYDGQAFAWIVIGKHSENFDGYTEDSAPDETKDIPAEGDTIVLDGNRHRNEQGEYDKTDRQNVIILETTGEYAPRIACYANITEYKHTITKSVNGSNKEVSLSVFETSPKGGTKINSSRFEWISDDGSTINIINYRGDWDGNNTYHKNDQVNHNNAVWVCIANSGVDVQEEPSDGATYWKKVLSGVKGDKGDDGKTPQPTGSAETYYAITSSPSTEPDDSSWNQTPIDTSKYQGKFLWTDNRTEWKIGDKTEWISNKTCSYIGKDGSNGTSVSIKGSLSDIGELPVSGNVNGDSYLIDGYLWIYTGTSVDDDNHHNGFENVGKIKGEDGISATQYYYHVAWMNTSDNSDNSFTTTNPSGSSYAYIGTLIDTTENDSDDYTKYDWAYVKGDRGEDGKNAVRLDLTNESSTVTCDKDGNIIGTIQGTVAILYDGAKEADINMVSYSISSYKGLSSMPTISEGGVISGLSVSGGKTSLEASINIKAVYKNQNYYSTYTITKVLAGSDGIPATSYWIEPSATAIKVDSDGNANPSTITCKQYKQVGAESPVAGDKKIYYRHNRIDSRLWNEYTEAIIPAVNVEAYEFVLADMTPSDSSAIIYDRESIPVVKDGQNGNDGKDGQNGTDGKDGQNGTDGKDAYRVVVSPSVLIFDTDDNGRVDKSSLSGKTATIRVYQGDKDVSSQFSKYDSLPSNKYNCNGSLKDLNTYPLEIQVTAIETQDVTDAAGNESKISKTNGFLEFILTNNSATVTAHVDVQVNVAQFTGQMINTNKQFSKTLQEVSNRVDDKVGSSELTQFKAEITQTAREISLSVSEKSIGRRNMLVGSAFLRDDNNRIISNDARIEMNSGYNGTNCIKVIDDTDGISHYIGVYWDGSQGGKSIKIEKGKKYTISCYYKTNDTNAKFSLEAIYTDKETNAQRLERPKYLSPSSFNPKYNQWELFKTVIDTTDAESDYIAFNFWEYCNVNAGRINAYICRPMVEEGDTYNGWTLSQDDYDYIGGNMLDNTLSLDKSGSLYDVNGTLTPAGFGESTSIYKSFVYKLKGTVDSFSQLPSSGNVYNDTYFVRNDWTCYAYNGSEFVDVGNDSYHNVLEWRKGKPGAFTSFGLEANKDYVFSFMAKGTGLLTAYFYSPDTDVFVESSLGTTNISVNGNASFQLTNKWERYWVHWRPSDSLHKYVLLRLNRSFQSDGSAPITNCYIAQPKLEEGARVTEYTERKSDLIDKASLKAAGIEITSDMVELYGNQVKVSGAKGGTPVAMFENGMLNSKLINADKITARQLQTTGSNGQSVSIENGLMRVYGTNGRCNIEFGVNSNGEAILSYYDMNGKWLYDLGPNKLDGGQLKESKLDGDKYVYAVSFFGTNNFFTLETYINVTVKQVLGNYSIRLFGTNSYVDDDQEIEKNNAAHMGYKPFERLSASKVTTLYRYTAPRQSGTIIKDESYGLTTPALAKQADGKYFTSNSKLAINGQLTNLAPAGYYFRQSEQVMMAPYPMQSAEMQPAKFPAYSIRCLNINIDSTGAVMSGFNGMMSSLMRTIKIQI